MSALRERRPDGVELLRIDRPTIRNALDSSTLRQLVMALPELSEGPTLRVLILSTTPIDAFCAGADVTEPLDAESGVARMEASPSCANPWSTFRSPPSPSAPTTTACRR